MRTQMKTLRLRDTLRAEIERIARRSRRSFSEVTQDLIDEALRMRASPGIYFADEPAGREAKVAGSGLGVAEIVAIFKAVDESERKLRARLSWLTAAQIRAALMYYHRYRAEIEAILEDNERAAAAVPPAIPARRVRRA